MACKDLILVVVRFQRGFSRKKMQGLGGLIKNFLNGTTRSIANVVAFIINFRANPSSDGRL